MPKRSVVFSPELVQRESCDAAVISVVEALYLTLQGEPAQLDYLYWFLSDKSDMVAQFTNGQSIALGPMQ